MERSEELQIFLDVDFDRFANAIRSRNSIMKILRC
jgi:hypothetical protein